MSTIWNILNWYFSLNNTFFFQFWGFISPLKICSACWGGWNCFYNLLHDSFFPSWISKLATILPLGQLLLWPATKDGFQFLVWIELKVFNFNNSSSYFIIYPCRRNCTTSMLSNPQRMMKDSSFRDTSEGNSLHKHNMIGYSQRFTPSGEV